MTGKNIALWEVFVFGFMFHPEGAKDFEVPIRDPTIAEDRESRKQCSGIEIENNGSLT